MYGEKLALSRHETANTLGVSLRTVDYLLAGGTLRGRRIGRRVVIPKIEVERFLRQDTSVVQGRVDHPVESGS